MIHLPDDTGLLSYLNRCFTRTAKAGLPSHHMHINLHSNVGLRKRNQPIYTYIGVYD